MYVYVRVYSGEHDTEAITKAIQHFWPGLDFDVQPILPEELPTTESDAREDRFNDLPVYRILFPDDSKAVMDEAFKEGEVVKTYRGMEFGVF